MEAKDTVMNSNEIDTRLCNYALGFSVEDMAQIRNIAQLQAEISFKAGIKEVVEWVKVFAGRDSTTTSSGKSFVLVTFIEEKWQAKLKEWGV